MKNLAAPHIRGLAPYEPGKPESELRRELGLSHVVKLASNENPYGPSPRAIDALQHIDLKRYPDPRTFALRQALASHHELPMGEIALGSGSNELIDLISRVFTSPGDHAVFGHPSFPSYRIACIAQHLEYSAVPLIDHLRWSTDDLLAAVRPTTKLLFLANPNNPTGSHVGKAELIKLFAALPPRVLLVVDEAYVQYADAHDYVSAIELREQRQSLIILRTFSKAYALAALRVGYAVARAPLIDALNRLRAPFNVNAAAQLVALAALEDHDHLHDTVQATLRERRRLSEALGALGHRVAPSQANFVLVDVGMPGRELYERLLQAGIIVRAMTSPLERWVRVTVGTPEENAALLDALKRIASMKDRHG